MNNHRVLNGYIAEEKFILACLERRIVIFTPELPIYHYDAVIVGEEKCHKIQVKKVYVDKNKTRRIELRSKSLRANGCIRKNHTALSDFIVAVDNNDFYIIPTNIIEAHNELCLKQYTRFINYFDQLK